MDNDKGQKDLPQVVVEFSPGSLDNGLAQLQTIGECSSVKLLFLFVHPDLTFSTGELEFVCRIVKKNELIRRLCIHGATSLLEGDALAWACLTNKSISCLILRGLRMRTETYHALQQRDFDHFKVQSCRIGEMESYLIQQYEQLVRQDAAPLKSVDIECDQMSNEWLDKLIPAIGNNKHGVTEIDINMAQGRSGANNYSRLEQLLATNRTAKGIWIRNIDGIPERRNIDFLLKALCCNKEIALEKLRLGNVMFSAVSLQSVLESAEQTLTGLTLDCWCVSPPRPVVPSSSPCFIKELTLEVGSEVFPEQNAFAGCSEFPELRRLVLTEVGFLVPTITFPSAQYIAFIIANAPKLQEIELYIMDCSNTGAFAIVANQIRLSKVARIFLTHCSFGPGACAAVFETMFSTRVGQASHPVEFRFHVDEEDFSEDFRAPGAPVLRALLGPTSRINKFSFRPDTYFLSPSDPSDGEGRVVDFDGSATSVILEALERPFGSLTSIDLLLDSCRIFANKKILSLLSQSIPNWSDSVKHFSLSIELGRTIDRTVISSFVGAISENQSLLSFKIIRGRESFGSVALSQIQEHVRQNRLLQWIEAEKEILPGFWPKILEKGNCAVSFCLVRKMAMEMVIAYKQRQPLPESLLPPRKRKR